MLLMEQSHCEIQENKPNSFDAEFQYCVITLEFKGISIKLSVEDYASIEIKKINDE